jgi:hypothetical protein
MKYCIIIFSLFILSCDSESGGTTEKINLSEPVSSKTAIPKDPKESITPIIDYYLVMKNALAADDSKGAAKAARNMKESLESMKVEDLGSEDQSTLVKVFSSIEENVKHIEVKSNNIKHQREHFESLSRDMYDLIKVTGTPKTLYKDFCPMANHHKGATWLSETKEIKNPYMGRSMSQCGEIKEEIK